ncbi:hypothetical protein ART_0769 [Arthrobacter sp. PAMC 25486]|nr:hypothetical protein ART_0769 [Arthrobacter sp. PAMC 25486]
MAQAELVKALIPSERVTVPWPDVVERLTKYDGGPHLMRSAHPAPVPETR